MSPDDGEDNGDEGAPPNFSVPFQNASNMQRLHSVKDIMKDASCLEAMLLEVGSGAGAGTVATSKGKGNKRKGDKGKKPQLIFGLNHQSATMEDSHLNCQFHALSDGCVANGAHDEISLFGSVHAYFTEDTQKLLSVVMTFDTFSIAYQLSTLTPLVVTDSCPQSPVSKVAESRSRTTAKSMRSIPEVVSTIPDLNSKDLHEVLQDVNSTRSSDGVYVGQNEVLKIHPLMKNHFLGVLEERGEGEGEKRKAPGSSKQNDFGLKVEEDKLTGMKVLVNSNDNNLYDEVYDDGHHNQQGHRKKAKRESSGGGAGRVVEMQKHDLQAEKVISDDDMSEERGEGMEGKRRGDKEEEGGRRRSGRAMRKPGILKEYGR